jgi:hypothetical protein
MNIIEFGNFLSHPQNITEEHTPDLEDVLDDFPYFQAAHFLYLNGLKNQNSFKYNNELKITATYTTDRSVMFDYIASSDFNNRLQTEALSLSKVSSVDEISFSEIKDGQIERKSVEVKELSGSSSTLPIGRPLKFDAKENHSFNEWLQITSINPILRGNDNELAVAETDVNVEKQEASSKTNFEIIEKFIASNPKIKADKTFTFSNQEFDISADNDSLMTETLAHVYLEQKKYDKAITAFTVLSLKYPEKNSFFANQIEAIKQLKEK